MAAIAASQPRQASQVGWTGGARGLEYIWHVDRDAGAGRRTHAPFGPEIPSHSGREAGGRGFEGESDHRTTYIRSLRFPGIQTFVIGMGSFGLKGASHSKSSPELRVKLQRIPSHKEGTTD